MTPQSIIVGTQGGFALPIAFLDAFGNPRDMTQGGLTAVADFYQPNLGRTTSCSVTFTNAASGQAVAIVPQDVALSTLQPSPSGVLFGAAAPAAGAPCRLHAYVVDSQDVASSHIVGAYQPVDPRTADLSSLPALQPLAVTVGPAGSAGPAGAPGAPGAAGSADPQPVTFGGAVAQHQVVYLDATGALPASCDQPAQAGRVLGLALAAGALGQGGQVSAAGIVTDAAWNWKPGPIFLGLGGGLAQAVPAAGFVQQVAVALSPTSIRMGLVRPVTIDVPAGFEGGTYLDVVAGAMTLKPAATPGSANAVVSTGPDGFVPAAFLAPLSIKPGRLVGGPHLASLPNGCFEDGFNGWQTSVSGTAEASIDGAVSAVGRQSAYLHCPAPGDVAAVASAPVPCGEGVPVYVATRAMLRSGVALAVLSAIFYDRNGAAIGQPVQIGDPLALGQAFVEFGSYALPPKGTRYGAAVVSNTAAVGAVGAVNVDEIMLQRQVGGPAAWQVRQAAGPALVGAGGSLGALLATVDDSAAAYSAAPAPIGGLLYGAISSYLQSLGLQDPQLTAVLTGIWGAAGSILPAPTGSPAPPPVVASAKTSQVIRAVKPVLVSRGGTFGDFMSKYVLDPDDTDGSWEALYVDPAAPIGGVLYARLLSYLTDLPARGLGQPADQSRADLAAAWTAALSITS